MRETKQYYLIEEKCKKLKIEDSILKILLPYIYERIEDVEDEAYSDGYMSGYKDAENEYGE